MIDKSSRAAVVKVCEQFIARSIAQGMGKGKARDRAALEFIVGAASLANALDDKALYEPLTMLAFLVSIRGFSEVQRRVDLARAEERGEP